MNTLINLKDSIVEIYRQLQRGQIGETAALARIEVKVEQLSIKADKLAASSCATCDEIGRIENSVVEVAFKPTWEE